MILGKLRSLETWLLVRLMKSAPTLTRSQRDQLQATAFWLPVLPLGEDPPARGRGEAAIREARRIDAINLLGEEDEEDRRCLGCALTEGPVISREEFQSVDWMLCGDCVQETGMAMDMAAEA